MKGIITFAAPAFLAACTSPNYIITTEEMIEATKPQANAYIDCVAENHLELRSAENITVESLALASITGCIKEKNEFVHALAVIRGDYGFASRSGEEFENMQYNQIIRREIKIRASSSRPAQTNGAISRRHGQPSHFL